MAKQNKQKNKQSEPPQEAGIFTKTWLNILLLFVFAPAGIYLIWLNKKFNPVIRTILSLLFGIAFVSTIIRIPGLSPGAKLTSPPVAIQHDATNTEKDNSSTESTTDSTTDQNSGAVTKVEDSELDTTAYVPPVLPSPKFSAGKLLEVHFLDVGQADSILIHSPDGTAVLIDGGNTDDGAFVVKYIKSLGISELEAIVATLPNEEHIGGLDTILSQIPVKNVYMPNVATDTQIYKDFIKAVDLSGANKISVKTGKSIETNLSDLSMVFLAPNNSKYDELNNYSSVLKLKYRDISFLFAGDAENISEQEMVDLRRNLSATVLKIGHHGSSSSTSQEFLNQIKPEYAVISLGIDNKYNYPAKETINKLKAAEASILRTDKLGTIIMETDGSKLGIKAIKN
ncbi:MAG: MBL fold metallo-hydrolase [Eubacteriales bacterium]